MNQHRGALYIATQTAAYAAEAFLSAWSLKRRNPEIAITMMTDLDTASPLFERVYDDVVDVRPLLADRRSLGRDATWGEGLISRCICLQRSPYRRTLFIDTDTRVRTSGLGALFARLDRCQIAMVEALPCDSRSRRLSGMPMYNAGVMLFQSRDRTAELLEAWLRLFEANAEIARRQPFRPVPWLPAELGDADQRWLLTTSQVSLARLLSPTVNRFDLRHEILPRAWNRRGWDEPAAGEIIHIDHRQPLRRRLRDDLRALAARLRACGEGFFASRLEVAFDDGVSERALPTAEEELQRLRRELRINERIEACPST